MLRGLLVLLTVTSVALAAIARRPLSPKPDKFKGIEGCYIEELDAVVPIGKARPSTTSCVEYRCNKNEVVIVSCGAVADQSPCTKKKDVGPYPACCDQIVCP